MATVDVDFENSINNLIKIWQKIFLENRIRDGMWIELVKGQTPFSTRERKTEQESSKDCGVTLSKRELDLSSLVSSTTNGLFDLLKYCSSLIETYGITD
jgi:ribonuclease PH